MDLSYFLWVPLLDLVYGETRGKPLIWGGPCNPNSENGLMWLLWIQERAKGGGGNQVKSTKRTSNKCSR